MKLKDLFEAEKAPKEFRLGQKVVVDPSLIGGAEGGTIASILLVPSQSGSYWGRAAPKDSHFQVVKTAKGKFNIPIDKISSKSGKPDEETAKVKKEKTPEQRKRERQKRADREHADFVRRKNFSTNVDALKAQARENDPYKDIGNIVLGNELKSSTMTAATRKSKREAEERIKANIEHVKTSGFNQSYAKKRGLDEGMYVVKSADGVEKRFKDANSAEAKAWKEKTAKKAKVKPAQYSTEYWQALEDKALDNRDRNFVAPWDDITYDDDGVEAIVKSEFHSKNLDWTFGRKGKMVRDGVQCATVQIRVMFEYGPEDDLGLEEPVSDAQTILVGRSPKNPKQLDFIKYVG